MRRWARHTKLLMREIVRQTSFFRNRIWRYPRAEALDPVFSMSKRAQPGAPGAPGRLSDWLLIQARGLRKKDAVHKYGLGWANQPEAPCWKEQFGLVPQKPFR